MPYAKGSCVTCGKEPKPNRSRCASCLETRRAADAVLREERKSKGKCVTCGARAKRGRRYCPTHLAYYAARVAAAKPPKRRSATK